MQHSRWLHVDFACWVMVHPHWNCRFPTHPNGWVRLPGYDVEPPVVTPDWVAPATFVLSKRAKIAVTNRLSCPLRSSFNRLHGGFKMVTHPTFGVSAFNSSPLPSSRIAVSIPRAFAVLSVRVSGSSDQRKWLTLMSLMQVVVCFVFSSSLPLSLKLQCKGPTIRSQQHPVYSWDYDNL